MKSMRSQRSPWLRVVAYRTTGTIASRDWAPAFKQKELNQTVAPIALFPIPGGADPDGGHFSSRDRAGQSLRQRSRALLPSFSSSAYQGAAVHRWFVMKKPATASKAQIEQFSKAVGFADNRPIQANNARAVLR